MLFGCQAVLSAEEKAKVDASFEKIRTKGDYDPPRYRMVVTGWDGDEHEDEADDEEDEDEDKDDEGPKAGKKRKAEEDDDDDEGLNNSTDK